MSRSQSSDMIARLSLSLSSSERERATEASATLPRTGGVAVPVVGQDSPPMGDRVMTVGVRGLRPNEPLGITPEGIGHSARWIAVWGRDPDLERAVHRVMRDLVGEVGERSLPRG